MSSPRLPSTLFVLAALICCGASAADDAQPNIVLIISDDQGWPDFGFAGSEVVKTPNLDALARESRVFNYAFNTSSRCRPSS